MMKHYISVIYGGERGCAYEEKWGVTYGQDSVYWHQEYIQRLNIIYLGDIWGGKGDVAYGKTWGVTDGEESVCMCEPGTALRTRGGRICSGADLFATAARQTS